MVKVRASKISRLEMNLPHFHDLQQFCLYIDIRQEARLLETGPTNCVIETLQPNTGKVVSIFRKEDERENG